MFDDALVRFVTIHVAKSREMLNVPRPIIAETVRQVLDCLHDNLDPGTTVDDLAMEWTHCESCSSLCLWDQTKQVDDECTRICKDCLNADVEPKE